MRVRIPLLLTLVLLLPGSALRAARAETWVKLVAPDFTVITPLPEKQAVAWAGQFAQYVAAQRSLFHAQQKILAPLTVVLFARDRDFHGYRPVGENGKPQEVDGFFLRHESWAVAGMAGSELTDELRRTIFHEGVHWFLSNLERQNPVWLEEGLAEVFSTFSVAKDQVNWGRQIDNHVALLRLERPLPLEQLFSTARSDLFGDDSVHTSLVYAESWAFIHFLLFGQHNMARDSLANFLHALQAGTSTEAAFRTAFGRSYADMDQLLAEYIGGGRYYVRSSALVTVEAPKIEPASAVEVANALARLAYAAHRWAEAEKHARAAIAAAPGDPRGHEVLALVLKEQDNADASNEAFQHAIEAGSKDFQPFFEVAMAAQNAAVGPGGLGTMPPADARRVANNYERAINLRPRFLPAYQNLAGVMGVAEPWGPADREFFEFGVKLFPRDPMILLGLAILSHRAGENAGAKAQLREVLAMEDLKTTTRNFARRLEDSWAGEEILVELKRLTDAKQTREALAFLERTLAADDLGSQLRRQLESAQQQLRYTAQVADLDAALRERRWKDARQIAHEVLESRASPGLKMQVRQTLERLDRQKLGM